MKIEIKTTAEKATNGKAVINAANVTFEDVGNGSDAKMYRVSFTNYKGNVIAELPTLYVDKADIKRLAKAS